MAPSGARRWLRVNCVFFSFFTKRKKKNAADVGSWISFPLLPAGAACLESRSEVTWPQIDGS